jgi:VanZ family protein
MGVKQGAMNRISSTYRRRLAVLLTIVLGVAIVWITLTPQSLPESGAIPLDKIAHLVAFTALILPTAWLYPRALFVTLPLAVLLGAAIELLQPLVGRGREFADFLMDIIGLGSGIVLGAGLRRLKKTSA